MTDLAGNTQRLLSNLFCKLGKRFLSFETEKVVKVASIREEFFDCYRFSLVVWVVGRLLVNQWQMVFNYQHNSSMVVIICFLLWQIASIYLFISNHKLISKAYCLYLRVPIDKPFLMNGIPRAASPFVSRRNCAAAPAREIPGDQIRPKMDWSTPPTN